MKVLYSTQVSYLNYLQRLRLSRSGLLWSLVALGITTFAFLNCIIFATWLPIAISGAMTVSILGFILVQLYTHRYFIKDIKIGQAKSTLTLWKFHMELEAYEVNNDQLEVGFSQIQKSGEIQMTIWESDHLILTQAMVGGWTAEKFKYTLLAIRKAKGENITLQDKAWLIKLNELINKQKSYLWDSAHLMKSSIGK